MANLLEELKQKQAQQQAAAAPEQQQYIQPEAEAVAIENKPNLLDQIASRQRVDIDPQTSATPNMPIGAAPGMQPILPDADITGVQRATPITKMLPEIQDSGILSGENSAKIAAIAPVLVTATNPNEIADIISSNFPNIGVQYGKDAKGEIFPILRNNETGAYAQINRPGISGIDIAQTLGIGAALFPSTKAATATGAALKAGGIQTGIEGAQAAAGGEFNLTDIGLAAAGGWGGQKLTQIMQAPRLRNFYDSSTGLPTKEFEKALAKRGLDFGAIVDDPKMIPITKTTDTADEVVEKIIRKKLESGSAADALYNKKLVDGKIVDYNTADEALRQGFRKGDIAMVKSSNKGTKEEMSRMLRMKRAIQAESQKVHEFQPIDVIGENTAARYKFVANRADELTKELDDIARKQLVMGKNLIESDATKGRALKGLAIDPSGVERRFFNGLDELGVSYDMTEVPPKLNFSASIISEDKKSQSVIKAASRLLAKDQAGDAYGAHLLKREFDAMIDYKGSKSRVTKEGKNFAKMIRAEINNSIREVSPRYAAINDELSMALNGMEEFQNAFPGINISRESSKTAIGRKMRRLISNADTATRINDAVLDINDIAQKMGGRFDVDLGRLVSFNNALDDQFGATTKGSLQGIMESVEKPTMARAKDFVYDAAGNIVRKSAEKSGLITEANETNAFNVMQRLLKDR